MYRPQQFFEVNEPNWQGFWTEADPDAPPTSQGAGVSWFGKITKVGT